jgi:hypothetical protein
MRLKSYREIFEDMRDYVVAHQNKITDFNEGSVAASMPEAVAREVATLYHKTVANIELYGRGMVYAQLEKGDYSMNDETILVELKHIKESINEIKARFEKPEAVPVALKDIEDMNRRQDERLAPRRRRRLRSL